MKKIVWIIRKELIESKWQYLATYSFSLILGLVICLSFKTNQMLNKLNAFPNWDADMIILPKGENPDSLEKSIANGISKNLLPKLIYKTTVELVEGKLSIMALLPNGDSVMVDKVLSSTTSDFHPWFLEQKKITGLIDSTAIRTEEWGNQVINAMLVKGELVYLNKLKAIVDKKTIAQAFILEQFKLERKEKLDKIEKLLNIQFGTIFILSLIGIIHFLIQFFSKLSAIKIVLTELGYNQKELIELQSILLLINCFIPIIIGSLLGTVLFKDFFQLL